MKHYPYQHLVAAVLAACTASIIPFPATAGPGNDTITGTAGNDVLGGGAGDDTISGLGGDDRLYGEGDNDTLNGNDGADQLYGGDGDDVLLDGLGSDILDGGPGEDTLITGDLGTAEADPSVQDKLYGRDGNDWLRVIGETAGRVYVFGQNGDDIIDGSMADGTTRCNQCSGGAGADHITGTGGDDLIQGDDGDDVLLGEAGKDALYGGAGADYVAGGDGGDELFGGAGNDTLQGGGGSDWIHLDDGAPGDADGTDPRGDMAADVVFSDLTQAQPISGVHLACGDPAEPRPTVDIVYGLGAQDRIVIFDDGAPFAPFSMSQDFFFECDWDGDGTFESVWVAVSNAFTGAPVERNGVPMVILNTRDTDIVATISPDFGTFTISR